MPRINLPSEPSGPPPWERIEIAGIDVTGNGSGVRVTNPIDGAPIFYSREQVATCIAWSDKFIKEGGYPKDATLPAAYDILAEVLGRSDSIPGMLVIRRAGEQYEFAEECLEHPITVEQIMGPLILKTPSAKRPAPSDFDDESLEGLAVELLAADYRRNRRNKVNAANRRIQQAREREIATANDTASFQDSSRGRPSKRARFTQFNKVYNGKGKAKATAIPEVVIPVSTPYCTSGALPHRRSASPHRMRYPARSETRSSSPVEPPSPTLSELRQNATITSTFHRWRTGKPTGFSNAPYTTPPAVTPIFDRSLDAVGSSSNAAGTSNATAGPSQPGAAPSNPITEPSDDVPSSSGTSNDSAGPSGATPAATSTSDSNGDELSNAFGSMDVDQMNA
ncbi:hypothetical protein C8J56DRAFT_892708 [Mycena floridula]|nr:hypothetical protein C8J56DRAFT_892708 [Mycena floridula]